MNVNANKALHDWCAIDEADKYPHKIESIRIMNEFKCTAQWMRCSSNFDLLHHYIKWISIVYSQPNNRNHVQCDGNVHIFIIGFFLFPPQLCIVNDLLAEILHHWVCQSIECDANIKFKIVLIKSKFVTWKLIMFSSHCKTWSDKEKFIDSTTCNTMALHLNNPFWIEINNAFAYNCI